MTSLHFYGVSRSNDSAQALVLHFDREPTTEEMVAIHERLKELRRMGVSSKSGETAVTNTVRRWHMLAHCYGTHEGEAAYEVETEPCEMVDGEWVKYDDIKHLLHPEPTGEPSIRDQVNSSMARQMAAKLDSMIKSALDRYLGVWSTDDLKRRCQLVSVSGNPVQTLYADGKPILEIHPIDVETMKTDTGWSLRATQKYRNL